jgi:glycosyltransferase involved in cell wall biosynthesis
LKRILVISFYYQPDLCAGSFRTTALVEALNQLAPGDLEVDVLTTFPNRYASFAKNCPEMEETGIARIHRIKISSHQSDMAGQSRAFMTFARQVNELTKSQDYDLIFATSSRLMTAALGAWISRRKRTRLYLDIRDIFADTIREVIPQPAAFLAGKVFDVIEKRTMQRASNINLVSPGFGPYFRDRYPGQSLTWFTNGIDPEFIEWTITAATIQQPDNCLKILYAGNIGEGQCLHKIVPPLALALRDKAKFTIIGDGGRRQHLEAAIGELGVENVELHSPVSRDRLIEEYKKANVLFLHLGQYRAFEKVLPSKLFEYGAMGKPILAGVSGFSSEFIREELTNAAVFTPGDVGGAISALDSLHLVDAPRTQFIEKYSRENISQSMAKNILNWVSGTA